MTDPSNASGTAATGPGANPELREEFSDEVRHDADRLRHSATDRARTEAERRKGQTVRVADSASSALNNAAGELEGDPDAPEWLGTAMRKAAGQIERLANQMDGRSVDDMTREASRFAREHPGLFLAAAAATGFAAARVLRAGTQHHHHADQQSGQYSGQYQSQPAPGATGQGGQWQSGTEAMP